VGRVGHGSVHWWVVRGSQNVIHCQVCIHVCMSVLLWKRDILTHITNALVSEVPNEIKCFQLLRFVQVTCIVLFCSSLQRIFIHALDISWVKMSVLCTFVCRQWSDRCYLLLSSALSCLQTMQMVIQFFMAALCNRGGALYFCPVFSVFFCLSSFFRRLISAAAGWMSTILWYMPWP